MALKALLLKKQIDNKRKALNELLETRKAHEAREAELTKAIEEVETEEQRSEVEGMVTEFESERDANETAIADLEGEIAGLESDLEAEEAKQNTEPPAGTEGTNDPQTPADNNERRNDNMLNRTQIPGMTLRDRIADITTRDDVKDYLAEVRAAMKEKRALTNIGVTIPEVMLGLIRENITEYSRLYRHVTVRPVGGAAKQNIMGPVPEAIWIDCCASLNELSLAFYMLTMDCYKVGGYFAVCNATIEDSDVNLATELLSAIGQAIGIALDHAILYGRNGSGTMNMPQGIVSRLVQTEEPATYPAVARPWADLHTSNVISITAANSTGVKLFQSLMTAMAAAKHKYGTGGLVHVMNETTHTKLKAEAMSINAAGAVVSGLDGTMPVIGGAIVELSFIPDNVIISGYFDLYILAERAGNKFASSEHVRFIQDQTVYKGTARYDGDLAIAEAFVAIGISGATPTATSTFPTDTAN